MIYKETLINIQSWKEAEAKISALSSEKERGNAFEYFCEAYLQLIPEYRIKNVWLRGHFPHRIIQHLHLIGQKDQGIDLIAETNDGKIWATQAKFRSDRKNVVSYKELSTFLAISDRADYRLIISNTERLPSVVEKRKSFGEVLVDRLDGLDRSFFKTFKAYLESKKPPTIKPFIPKPHQKKVIKAAVAHFKSSSRGQLIMACGTGKTLASVWIAEALKAKYILVMVPSLALMRQTISVWAKNYKAFPFNYLCVCSDESVAHDVRSDYAVSHLWEMDVPVTTDARSARRFISVHKNKPIIIFSTYQSSPVVSEAILRVPGYKFDLTICDEAHRTAGLSKSIFNLVLSDEQISATKRLFMTATPRILAKHVIKRGVEEDIELFSMADEKKYGKEFSHLSFGEAIKRRLLTDYKVVIAIISDKEMAAIISQRGRVQIESKTTKERDVKALAKQVAFLKAVKDYRIHHAISYHSRVAFAKDFADPENDCSIISVNDLLKRYSQKPLTIDAFHVNGTMSSAERSTILRDFTESDYSVVSNARCLTEGVDIPAVDGVLFFDPKYRLTDIVQATGRAIRLHKGKRYGYIIVPVFVEKGEDVETALESSDFDQVWSVIKAMQSQDERLDEVISRIRTLDGQIQGGNKDVASKRQSLEENLFERIKILDIPRKISARAFIHKIETKLLDKIGYSWDFMYGVLAAFRNKYPYRWPIITERYKKIQLGQWCFNQRQFRKKGLLPEDRIGKLDKINFVWTPRDEKWEYAFDLLKEYRNTSPKQWPECNEVFKNFNLGMWCTGQRQLKRKGRLPSYKIYKFNRIAFPWALRNPDTIWSNNFTILKDYRRRYPDKWPFSKEIYKGFELGQWCDMQRQFRKANSLSKKRINNLDSIGFPWKPHDVKWENYFKYLKEYRLINPKEWPPHALVYKSVRLGKWCAKQRRLWKSLQKKRRAMLAAIGFPISAKGGKEWLTAQWFKNFNRLKQYRRDNPFKWAAPSCMYKGANLGNWFSWQRYKIKKGLLSKEQVKLLRGVQFPLDLRDESWESAFNLLRQFRKQNQNTWPSPLKKYKGINLFVWCHNQRTLRTKGSLASHRIEKLDSIGFIWNPHERAWMQSLNILKDMRHKYPHRWPKAKEIYKGYKIGQWCDCQRHNKKRGFLSKDRIKKLNAIKFLWSMHKKS